VINRLSGELTRRHRLVTAQSLDRVNGQRLSRYRFRHYLFQHYLYSQLDPVQHAHLHEAVGRATEGLFGEHLDEVAVPLARHFQEAGITEKAIDYLQQAAQRDLRLSANQEAIRHFTLGLELLETLPESHDRLRRRLSLLSGLAMPLQAVRGYFHPDVGATYYQALDLCEELGEDQRRFHLTIMLNTYHAFRGEYQMALEIGQQAITLANDMGDQLLVSPAHITLAWVVLLVGEFQKARHHLSISLDAYDPAVHRPLATVTGVEPGISSLMWLGWSLWFLGFPDQALRRCYESVAMAREAGNLYQLAFALNGIPCVAAYFLGDIEEARARAEESIQISTENEFGFQLPAALVAHGWTLVTMGEVEQGMRQMRDTLESLSQAGSKAFYPLLLSYYIDALRKAGRWAEGLAAIDQAFAVGAETGEHWFDAEFHRQKGEMLVARGFEQEAESEFQEALDVARAQEAKSWELRAATSMARLWQRQGRPPVGATGRSPLQVLAEVYNWFTEGFDTRDLQEARALLEELSDGAAA
jgi:adenylate cyclase